jgi:group I intron endonuclease
MTTIYKITNLVNSKSYIGLTTRDIKYRFQEHGKPSRGKVSAITKAIQKYGKENFKFEIIWKTTNASFMEQYFIRLHNTIAPNGYNLTYGGEKPEFTIEECQKRSERRKRQSPPVPKGTKQNKEWLNKRVSSRKATYALRKLNKEKEVGTS